VTQSPTQPTAARPPAFIVPMSIVDMTDDEQRSWVSRIRTRRVELARLYHEQQLVSRSELNAKLCKTLDKQQSLLDREWKRLDSLLAKVDGRLNKIALLRVEIEQTSTPADTQVASTQLPAPETPDNGGEDD
jgi:hypothetical protein